MKILIRFSFQKTLELLYRHVDSFLFCQYENLHKSTLFVSPFFVKTENVLMLVKRHSIFLKDCFGAIQDIKRQECKTNFDFPKIQISF